MDERKKELLDGLFHKWGSPYNEGEIRIHEFCIRADSLDTVDRIKSYDNSAARTIAEMETAIETLKAYRETLQERYNFLSTAPYNTVIRLRREKRWKGSVTFHLETIRRYIGGDLEVIEKDDRFPGNERHKAIAAYKAYIKAHPGISAEMDIEKGKWEK